jgi:hypothetical protein
VFKVQPVKQARKAQLVQLVQPALKVFKVQPVQQAHKVQLGQLV